MPVRTAVELVALAQASEPMASVLGGGDWYLVGSRGAGVDDDLSDWDTILLTGYDVEPEDLPRESLDAAFGVSRPAVPGPPDLALHVRWRRVAGVDVQVVGPAGRLARERDLPAVWAFELRHAIPLRLTAEIGEPYRAHVAGQFARRRSELARHAYREFRTSRNEAVASLPRDDHAAQALTAATCVGWAARHWLLAEGVPHPSDKWLLRVLERDHGPATLLAAMRAAVDLRHEPAVRFDELWRLWELVDDHARTVGDGHSGAGDEPAT
jgi:hypothetical protein